VAHPSNALLGLALEVPGLARNRAVKS